MVSKVAVVALVAVLAVPILLGYGLSLSEVQETDYKPDKDTINVTEMLENTTAYTYANADINTINSKFKIGVDTPIEPIYEKYSQNKTSNHGTQRIRTNIVNSTDLVENYNRYSWMFNYDPTAGQINVEVVKYVNDSPVTQTLQKIHSYYIDYSSTTPILKYSLYPADLRDPFIYGTIDNPYSVHLTKSGSFTMTLQQVWNESNGSRRDYFDISSGYHFMGTPANSGSNWDIVLPDHTKSILLTINLDTITDSSYQIRISDNLLEKTTTGGVVSWKLVTFTDGGVRDQEIDLYYDPEKSDNTYQVSLNVEKTNTDSQYHYYTKNNEYRYVGSWPTIIGPANYYWSYSWENHFKTTIGQGEYNMNSLSIGAYNRLNMLDRSPTIRMDAAQFAAFTYPAIENRTYYPASLKDNPITTIKNPQKFGTSIVFGGETFNVGSDGNITIGTHAVSLNNVKFTSYAVPGGYVNKINDYRISTTPEPSFIRMYGIWALGSIETDSQTVTTYTKTEWIPGEFAWDGIDQNFLMAGLITCLGVFVGLGIYLRKTRSSIWPLLIVCGCAAGLFICMI